MSKKTTYIVFLLLALALTPFALRSFTQTSSEGNGVELPEALIHTGADGNELGPSESLIQTGTDDNETGATRDVHTNRYRRKRS